MRYVLLLSVVLFTHCTKPNDAKKPCEVLTEAMDGTYDITVTSYPLQTSQEGDEKEVLVFFSPKDCNTGATKDIIRFNNLFRFYDCDTFDWLKKNTFTIVYDDGVLWNGAPVAGSGTIINGVFRFEGTVDTFWGVYPIVLDGKKKTSFRRTSAC